MDTKTLPTLKEEQPYEGATLPLPPSALRLSRRQDGQYAAEWGAHHVVVQVTRCFPWTEPGRHISLRDADERELCFVNQLEDLDPESRTVLQQALAEVSFVIEITGIEALQEEYEIRTWRVHTVQGSRSFQTKRDEWPQEMPNGGLLIRDVAGDLFFIRQLDGLDAESRKRLAWYVD
jgi:hypothetical protein